MDDPPRVLRELPKGVSMFILAQITDDFDELTADEMDNLALLMPEFIIKLYDYWIRPSAVWCLLATLP